MLAITCCGENLRTDYFVRLVISGQISIAKNFVAKKYFRESRKKMMKKFACKQENV